MLESQLQVILRNVLLTGFALRGYPAMLVTQSDQSRAQGVPTDATVFFQQIGTARRYGFPGKKDVLNKTDPNNLFFDHTESTLYESRYQIAPLSPQSPANGAVPTSTDYANIASEILQSDAAIATFLENGIAILRITDISTLWFTNDKGQQDANPTFQIILRHISAFTSPVAVVSEILANVNTV